MKGEKAGFVLFVAFEWLLNPMTSFGIQTRASQEMTEIDTSFRKIEDLSTASSIAGRVLLVRGW